MKTGGDLIRARAQTAARIWAAALIALAIAAAPISAASGPAADTAAAASMYEVAGDSSGASAAASAGAADSSGFIPPPSAADTSSVPKTETVVVPNSEPAPPYIKRGAGIPQTTTEIPQASPDSSNGEASGGADGGQIVNYEKSQNPDMMEPQLHSLQEFMNEGDNTSPLGIEVREGRHKLKSGEEVDGLLIVGVTNGSPAAKAGLHASRRTVRDVLEAASFAAALVFPPAVIAVPLVDQVHIGESYDLIIGVDGARVTNFLDFEDRMRDVQPGEIVYLSIVRNGSRLQVPVNVPATLPPPVF